MQRRQNTYYGSMDSGKAARSSEMSLKHLITEAKAFAEKLIHCKGKEEAEYDYSFADEYFSIFY